MVLKISDDAIARRFIVDDMKPMELGYNESTGEAEYTAVKHMGKGIYPDYPILIQGNGVPWTLGNIYLLKRLEDRPRYEPKTWQNISIDLLHYLRWLEQTNTNPLHFPAKQKFNRPTYKYRAHLIDLINEGAIKASTAAGRMSTIINFYRGLVKYEILNNNLIELAWEERTVLINVIGRDLQSKQYTIPTTDLAIKKPQKAHGDEFIQDDGNLRPLSRNEQEIIIRHIQSSAPSIRLIFTFALLTGARMQTICTLRGKTLQDAIFDEENNCYYLNVGGRNSLVDTKGSKNLVIVVPAKLHKILLQYWSSPNSVNRRVRSFYGNTANNYLFLNANATPYLTSKMEKIDRRDPSVNARVSLDGGASKTRGGQSIWEYINNTLLVRIRKEFPDFKTFRFHDLRATFGMNLLETLLRLVDNINAELKIKGKAKEISSDWVLEQVKDRMGHSDMRTTMEYLNFKHNHQFKAHLQIKVEDELMQYVSTEVLTYNE